MLLTLRDLPRGPSTFLTEKCSSRDEKCRDWRFLSKHDARSFELVSIKSVCELIEPARRYYLWEKTNISSVLSHIITHLRRLDSDSEASSSSGAHYPRITLPTTAPDTLNRGDWFRADCVHTVLSCNVGSFGTECRDKPALAGWYSSCSIHQKAP